jgi:hypothetical protein
MRAIREGDAMKGEAFLLAHGRTAARHVEPIDQGHRRSFARIGREG